MGNKTKKHQLKKFEKSSSIIPDYSSSSNFTKHQDKKCKPKPKPKPYNKSGCGCGCGCEQEFYSPLPNLAVRPQSEQVLPLEWFAPGSVQACCSICSTVKPVYANTCTGYCCRN